MIVTFHIAIYLVYQLLENYIYPLFGDNEEEDASDDQENDQNLGSVSPNNPNAKVASKTNTTSTSKNEPLADKQNTDKPTKGVQEGEDIPSLYNENQEGYKYIYEGESTFTCYLDPEDKGIKFIPPVYTQRYMTIADILNKECWKNSIKKVVDFGCAELSFEVIYLKKLFGINDIVSVDIDEDLLERNVCKIGPTATDYLSQRPTPLSMRVFCGSVGCTNAALDGADAVIAIELVEHLYPDDLERLPFTVFGYMSPLIAIFTTPNADFNVLFTNFSGFRHPDHKFEWSRQQFEDWGNNLVQRYPEYTVTYQGIGRGVEGTEYLGCCSQMAVFVKVHQAQPLSEYEQHVQDGVYKLIREEIYPFFDDKRTRSEKIRDEANFFINRIKSLSAHYDEERIKEIPLKAVMEKVKCFNREKLIGILKTENWNVSTNKDGHEMIEIPESDEESSNSSMILSDYEPDHSNDKNNSYDLVYNDESWDCDNKETNPLENDEICVDLSDNSINCTEKVDSLVADCLYIPPYTDSNVSLVTSTAELSTCDKMNSPRERDSSESSVRPLTCVEQNVDSASGGTPSCTVEEQCKPHCEYVELNAEPIHCLNSPDICKKSISFETTDILYKGVCCTPGISNCKMSQDSQTSSFCCVTNSTCDIYTYATPKKRHSQRKSLPKSLSLQQINSCSKLDKVLFSRDDIGFGNENERFSRSIEGFKSQESCDILDTLSSASKVIDSGYPDSYSDHDMEMDLTPEQIEDIGSESNSSPSSRSLSPLLLPLHPNPHMIDNVENGDVANNNRDGEGNNMIAEMEEEPLEFVAQIEEVNHEVPNMSAVNIENPPELSEKPENSKLIQESCPNDYEEHSKKDMYLEPQSSWTLLAVNHESSPFTKERQDSTNRSTKQMINGTKSDLSIATSSTWSHLGSTDSQSSCHVQDPSMASSDEKHSKIKPYNSLTTVLDGCSKYSECSLVNPSPIKNIEQGDLIDINSDQTHRFPDWLLTIDCSIFSSGDEVDIIKKTSANLPLLRSLSSVYQSADSSSSLISLNFESIDEGSIFPQWLLNIQSFDIEDEVINQDWNEDIIEDIPPLIFNVQVDARGGGDPQRETWF